MTLSKRLLVAFILCSCTLTAMPSYAEGFKALLLNRNAQSDTFWHNLSSFAQAAAKDLRIDLEVFYANQNDQALLDKFRAAAASPTPPQYVILHKTDVAMDILREANTKGIKTFVINGGFSEQEMQTLGKPREKVAHWLGQMVPNDQESGYLVGKYLLEAASIRSESLTVLPINGNLDHGVSSMRAEGLKRAIDEFPGAEQLEQVNSYWQADIARDATTRELSDNPKLKIVWTAADFLANAALTGAQDMGRNILTGGVDWSEKALEKVSRGELKVSVGGHFMEAAWALILLHDYHNGIDFAEAEGTLLQSKFFVLEPHSVDLYRNTFRDGDYNKIYFRRFSKVYNTHLRNYRFSLVNVMVQFLWS